jgi:hypothetical protein
MPSSNQRSFSGGFPGETKSSAWKMKSYFPLARGLLLMIQLRSCLWFRSDDLLSARSCAYFERRSAMNPISPFLCLLFLTIRFQHVGIVCSPYSVYLTVASSMSFLCVSSHPGYPSLPLSLNFIIGFVSSATSRSSIFFSNSVKAI